MSEFSDLLGMLRRDGQPTLSIDEINEATGDGWAGRRSPRGSQKSDLEPLGSHRAGRVKRK
jgi:hypothetical protein